MVFAPSKRVVFFPGPFSELDWGLFIGGPCIKNMSLRNPISQKTESSHLEKKKKTTERSGRTAGEKKEQKPKKEHRVMEEPQPEEEKEETKTKTKIGSWLRGGDWLSRAAPRLKGAALSCRQTLSCKK